VEKKMLNRLGRPNTAAFATFVYCAGLHLDNDESITHGWVIKHGKKVTSIIILIDFSNVLLQ
jgi:hypothetical protein